MARSGNPLKGSLLVSSLFFVLIISTIFATILVSSAIAASDVEEAKASAKAAAFVKKTTSSHSIVIFSKSYCPYCRRAKAVFEELKQAAHVVELDERADGWIIQDALGQIVGRRTVPQVFIKGKHLGGSDDTITAYENGELAKLLGLPAAGKDDL